ncbi:unnamed protein product [Polarella glacialis]|uniref:Phospholipase B-like n=1 Tax=Polarella glacialis TaxID=89957 RepID=A0A813KH21_POLGL|nr:unnamed protein product [Polarella glacialis]CAE8701948.1 unnamed protein product [Polarella glacialis]
MVSWHGFGLPLLVAVTAFLAGLVLGSAELPLNSCSAEGQSVSCFEGTDARNNALLLLTSSGLGAYGADSRTLVPNGNLTKAFRDLVLQLPDSSWETDGAKRKENARNRDVSMLAESGFYEPELFSGLQIVIVEDGCFVKDSFWNKENPDFHSGTNYQISGMTTSIELVRPFLGRGLDVGWCANYSQSKAGYFVALGFEAHRIRHVSLWDRLAGDSLKTQVFELLTTSRARGSMTADLEAETGSSEATAVVDLLRSADILHVNGGHPDFTQFVFKQFAREFLLPVVQRVKEGSVVYTGQSAGSMMGGADVGLSLQAPIFRDMVKRGDTTGLSLAGRCAVRPHDEGSAGSLWDLASAVYGKLKGLMVVRLPNAEALMCARGQCSVVGATGKPAASVISGQEPNLERLAEVFSVMGQPGASDAGPT